MASARGASVGNSVFPGLGGGDETKNVGSHCQGRVAEVLTSLGHVAGDAGGSLGDRLVAGMR